MSGLDPRFDAAVVASRKLDERPDDDSLLQLYALYKQATEGDVSGDRPGFFDFVGAAKYEAWELLSGMPSEEASRQYADLVIALGGQLD
jgi:acyl-CoA-binding protein